MELAKWEGSRLVLEHKSLKVTLVLEHKKEVKGHSMIRYSLEAGVAPLQWPRSPAPPVPPRAGVR